MIDQFVQLFGKQSFRYADELFAFCKSDDAHIPFDSHRAETKLTCKHYERIYRFRSDNLTRRFADDPYKDELLQAIDELCVGLTRNPNSPCCLWVIRGHPEFEYVAFENISERLIAGCLRFDRTISESRRLQTKASLPAHGSEGLASAVHDTDGSSIDRLNPMKSRFMDSVETVLSKHGDQLSDLIARELTAVKVVWDLEDDSWLADEPVVLIFGKLQLEIVFWQMNELALSWNSIDLNQSPNWFGCYGDMKLKWRDAHHAAAKAAIGKTITNLRLVELFSESKFVSKSQESDQQSGIWMLHALEFQFDNTTLTVFNALDENGISADQLTHERYRHTKIGTGRETN